MPNKQAIVFCREGPWARAAAKDLRVLDTENILLSALTAEVWDAQVAREEAIASAVARSGLASACTVIMLSGGMREYSEMLSLLIVSEARLAESVPLVVMASRVSSFANVTDFKLPLPAPPSLRAILASTSAKRLSAESRMALTSARSLQAPGTPDSPLTTCGVKEALACITHPLAHFIEDHFVDHRGIPIGKAKRVQRHQRDVIAKKRAAELAQQANALASILTSFHPIPDERLEVKCLATLLESLSDLAADLPGDSPLGEESIADLYRLVGHNMIRAQARIPSDRALFDEVGWSGR